MKNQSPYAEQMSKLSKKDKEWRHFFAHTDNAKKNAIDTPIGPLIPVARSVENWRGRKLFKPDFVIGPHCDQAGLSVINRSIDRVDLRWLDSDEIEVLEKLIKKNDRGKVFDTPKEAREVAIEILNKFCEFYEYKEFEMTGEVVF
jgi:hypothetical protein